MLSRVKYVSRFAQPLSAADIEAIVQDAQARNAAVELTGVLIAFGGVFMQIMEGPTDVLNGMFARIERDKRHCDLVVLRRTDVSQRLFGGWSMRRLELGEAAVREAKPLLDLIRAHSGDALDHRAAAQTLDALVWQTMNAQADSVARTG